LVWFITDRRPAVRNALVAALVSSADRPLKPKARQFLVGLSFDELQFIAEFLGACILESTERGRCSRSELAERIAQFQQGRLGYSPGCSEDQDHKMILLLEYLCRSGSRRISLVMRAGHA
jgi:hypothetical protein